jgi:hypothetical protein
LLVVALDDSSVAQKNLDLESLQVHKRDLALVDSLDSEKGFNESRTTLLMEKSEKHFIEDITSTEI